MRRTGRILASLSDNLMSIYKINYDYAEFLASENFSINAIRRFARTQKIMPYIVIGRLQKEKIIPYNVYSDYKLRYKWAE